MPGSFNDPAITDPTVAASDISLLKGLLTGQGAKADAAVTDPTASASAAALLKGILTKLGEGYKTTYRASLNAHAPAATPTDWLTILGSATKTIRITRIVIASRATGAGIYRVSVIKYSVAYTGGTPAAVAMIPLDSASAAATALVQTWASGLPTPGTPVGKLLDESVPQAVLATPTFDTRREWKFGDANGQTCVLRGVAQYLALNSAAVALPGGTVFDVTVEWTEE